jgi:hypothetical protein
LRVIFSEGSLFGIMRLLPVTPILEAKKMLSRNRLARVRRALTRARWGLQERGQCAIFGDCKDALRLPDMKSPQPLRSYRQKPHAGKP